MQELGQASISYCNRYRLWRCPTKLVKVGRLTNLDILWVASNSLPEQYQTAKGYAKWRNRLQLTRLLLLRADIFHIEDYALEKRMQECHKKRTKSVVLDIVDRALAQGNAREIGLWSRLTHKRCTSGAFDLPKLLFSLSCDVHHDFPDCFSFC